MLVNVREFGTAHAKQFRPSSPAGKAFTQVTKAVAAIEAHAASKIVTAREDRKTRAALRAAIRAQLQAIARTARGDRREHPDAPVVFPLPQQKSDDAMLASARAFISAGDEVIARFVTLGLPSKAFSDLQTLVDRFDEIDRGGRERRTGLAEAQEGIEAAIKHGTDAVQKLDVIVTNTFATNAVQLEEWRRARRWGRATAGARPAPTTDTTIRKAS
jgi:hypothetical protein